MCLGSSVGHKFDSAIDTSYGGLSSFFESQEFYDLFLKKYIEHCVSRYVSETRWSFIKPDTDYESVIDESWINIDGKGCYQSAHTHPRSIISGTYYHQCDGDEGNLVLYNPIPYIQYGQFPENIYTCGGELPVQIQKGKLALLKQTLREIILKTCSALLMLIFLLKRKTLKKL
mgnify:CR=1 FL=1